MHSYSVTIQRGQPVVRIINQHFVSGPNPSNGQLEIMTLSWIRLRKCCKQLDATMPKKKQWAMSLFPGTASSLFILPALRVVGQIFPKGPSSLQVLFITHSYIQSKI